MYMMMPETQKIEQLNGDFAFDRTTLHHRYISYSSSITLNSLLTARKLYTPF